MTDRDETIDLISSLGHIDMSRFNVVGSYARYDEAVRNKLKDAKSRISAGCTHPSPTRENHLIWSAPGTGKTYFVDQIAGGMAGVNYRPINLGDVNEPDFRAGLDRVKKDVGPTLCLVDEIDTNAGAPWPYEALLPYLDANTKSASGLVFVMVGSSGKSIDDLARLIESRSKGKDLLSRVPLENRWVIPPLSAGDRIVVVLSQMLNAAHELKWPIGSVEKLALYFVARSERTANARHLREFAVQAVQRASRLRENDDRIRYDDLFEAGDRERLLFQARADPAFSDAFVFIDDRRTVVSGQRSISKEAVDGVRPEDQPPLEHLITDEEGVPQLLMDADSAKRRLDDQNAVGKKLLRRLLKRGETHRFHRDLETWSVANHALLLTMFDTLHIAETQERLARGGLIAPDNYIVPTDKLEDKIVGQLQLIDQLLVGLPILAAHSDRLTRSQVKREGPIP